MSHTASVIGGSRCDTDKFSTGIPAQFVGRSDRGLPLRGGVIGGVMLNLICTRVVARDGGGSALKGLVTAHDGFALREA